MDKTKYGKYIFSGLREGQAPGRGIDLALLDSAIMKGSNFYRITWNDPLPPGVTDTNPPTHGPHIHKYAEILIHLGTNPNDPFDLGAEIEFCLGKEIEKHIITKSKYGYNNANETKHAEHSSNYI